MTENERGEEGEERGLEPVNGSSEANGSGSERDTREVEVSGEDPVELKARLGIKDNHIRELYDRVSASSLRADEALVAREAGEGRVRTLEDERARLKERIRALEEEARERRRRREGYERQISRLEREIERRDGEISHRDYLLERRAEEIEAFNRDASELINRKDQALQDALRRVEGLERDLEDRETETGELRSTVEELRADLEAERETRRRLADPANRLRAGIDLFNDSDQHNSMNALSRTMGQPEVHVDLEDKPEEPAVLLTFTWQDITRQTYAANPGPDVKEPRVYLSGAEEDLSGVDREPPNAHIGPGGRVQLGL